VFSSDQQDNDSNKFLIFFFDTKDYEISYTIRKMSNFNANLYSDFIDFGKSRGNRTLTIDLVYLQPGQH
jgi:hypothetical protein